MKIETIIITVLLIFASIITISCDPMYFKDGRHSTIILKNNSEKDVYVYRYGNYPDTTINESYPTSYKFRIVNAGTSNQVRPCPLGDWWEKVFDLDNLQCISIFILNATFIEPHMNDENFTVNETMALQRYDLTLEDLNGLDWTISYPPDERMKDMKMYPPYGN
ncbi:MAG: hypothetical protein LBN27_07320 [Prevotellaceae bacterium]|jgi:hypothetical protein|nr:hypothetical protein [Prevotellaceae bacterium]